MILLIALDTYYNFRFFSVRDEEGKDRVCGRQLVCLFMLHFLANVLIWLNTGSVTMLAFYGAQVLFFLLYIYLTACFTGTAPGFSSTICARSWQRDLLS